MNLCSARLRGVVGLVAALLGGACQRSEAGAGTDESPAASSSSMVIFVSGKGPMRCTPIGSASAGAIASVPPPPAGLDVPMADGGSAMMVFSVEIHANGEIFANQQRIDGDAALLEAAREARAKFEDVRAILRAAPDVPHGRVLRALDLLKQAGVSKIAFGTSSAPSEAAGSDATRP